jgi:spore coat protein H
LTYQYWISAVDIFGNTSAPVGPLQATPLPHSASPLPICRIDIDPDSLAALNQDPSQDVYYSCTVTLDDSTYDAGLRYRGHAIRKVLKKSHKIKLDGDLLYQDRRKLNCNSEMCDPCLMRESLSMDLLRDAGVPAPRTWWRAIVLNDEYMGAYCDVEQVDEHFLTWHGLDEDANIYKCHDRLVILGDSLEYLEKYEKETNEDGSWNDLIGFIEDLNLTPDEEFYEVFIDYLDFDEYLNYYTGLMLINDGDATFKNFFLYHDLDDDWWMIIPWDKDLTWGVRWLFFEGIYWTSALLQGHSSGGNMLTHRVFNEPLFKNIYASRIYEFLTERFPLDDVYARIDAAHALTEQNGVVDFRKWYWEDNTRMRDGDLEIREFAAGRYEHMLSQLTTLISPQELYINEFMAANSMTIADEHGEFDDWIEIHNPGPDPVFMGDYFLTDALRAPIQWAFPDTTLAPGGFLLVWADDDGWQGPLHANFKLDRNGELIALHKKEDGAGPEIGPDDIDPIDLLYFGPQVNDIARARMYDTDLRWVYPDSASPGTTNGDGQGIADPDLPQEGFGPLRVLACPNPFRESIALTLRGNRTDGTIEIFDVSGRLCRRLATPVAATGPLWIWDGRTDGGRQASPGAYWARLRTPSGGRTGATRLLLIR